MNAREVIAFGRTAEILSFDNQQVLKLFKSGIPEHMITAEFNISKVVFNLGILCPQPIELVDYGDRKGIIYSRVNGKTILNIISRKLWTINKEAKRMARIHYHIHRHSASDIPKQKEIITERIKQAPILSTEEKRRMILNLNELKEDNKLCHGDYHPDNIILDDQNEWIIDWMTGMEGNPAGDVARTFLLLKLGRMPEETPKIILGIVSRIRNQILKTYMNEYLKSSEITIKEIDQWITPVAAARLTEWIPDEEKRDLVELIRRSIV
ncbi:aminoglycoside phosphotransferase family protein [Cohnella sp. WQ 127256]|uniref:aminoglycoside phosphotransferase family protein n=1 Tax=Cohnella sp. WQ 127256 TaxID=2938790 RepID=UPI002118515E|nr:aminoglycoside phosphotransferase family protein [Cohnella sp. WQ 127256]